MRAHFENQLQNLQKDIIVMGSLCEEIIQECLKGLDYPDNVDQASSWNTFQRIEELERDIERRCIKLLLRQQPVARDLRLISSTLKMVYDIKRIGIQASEILELISKESSEFINQVFELKKMLILDLEMVSKSLDSYVMGSVELANSVIEKDDTIDNYFVIIKEKLSHCLVQDKKVADQVIDLLMIAKYLEKIGDHTVNIAKWVIYSIQG